MSMLLHIFWTQQCKYYVWLTLLIYVVTMYFMHVLNTYPQFPSTLIINIFYCDHDYPSIWGTLISYYKEIQQTMNMLHVLFNTGRQVVTHISLCGYLCRGF